MPSRRARSILAQARRRGEAIVLRRVTVTRNGPDQSKATVEYPSFGTFGPFQRQLIDGERIRSGDQRLLLPAIKLLATPEIGDQVVRSAMGRTLEVLAVEEVTCGSEITAFNLHLRGAG